MGTRDLARIVKEVVEVLMQDEVFVEAISNKVCDSVQRKLNEQKAYYESIVSDLSARNKHLEDLIDNQEQYSRRNCVRVFGVKEEPGENTENKVRDIIQNQMKVKIDSNMIDRCHRIGIKTINNVKPRSIIIKFTSYKTRELIIRNRKLLKGSKIVIKEDLTKKRLNLMMLACNKFGFKNVWSRDGKIYASVNKTVHPINDAESLNLIHNNTPL